MLTFLAFVLISSCVVDDVPEILAPPQIEQSQPEPRYQISPDGKMKVYE